VNPYARSLRKLCSENQSGVAPYHIRTRFERALYGSVCFYCETALGLKPNGLTSAHVEKILSNHAPGRADVSECLRSAASILERFTYLCDTSNWSNDGQDPRLESCRDDVIRLCDLLEQSTGDS